MSEEEGEHTEGEEMGVRGEGEDKWRWQEEGKSKKK